MDDLKRIEGKIIDSVSENNDGQNSYLIIKFKDGGKVNIVSFLRGDEGVAQLDIDLGKLKSEDLLGREIINVKEEFDGETDHLYLHLRGGDVIEITPFSSSPMATASLEATVYSGDKIVAESLSENMYQKWGEYSMSKPQYEDYDPVKTIGVAIEPKRKMAYTKIAKELKQHYDSVRLDLELTAGANMPILVINDDTASVEDVSDLLYKYIENGTVYAVDEI